MVYRSAVKKTGAYMALALILSLSLVLFFSGEASPAGRVTSPGLATPGEGAGLLGFVLGIVVGALIVGTYFYVVHIEKKR